MDAIDSLIDRLELSADRTASPTDDDFQWWQLKATFVRQAFMRLLIAGDDEGEARQLAVHFGLGLEDGESLADALGKRLSDHSPIEWHLDSVGGEFVLEAVLTNTEDHGPTLKAVLKEFDRWTKQLEDDHRQKAWQEFLGVRQHSEEETSPNPPQNAAFESIGTRSSASASEATIAATALTRLGERIRCAIGFHQPLGSPALNALEDGLELSIYTKFRARTETVLSDERAELRLPEAAKSTLYFDIYPGADQSPSKLEPKIEAYLEQLQSFSGAGIDLATYLGVSDTILDDSSDSGARDDGRRSRRSQTRKSQRSTKRRPSPTPAMEGGRSPADDGFVLGLDTESAGHGPLKPGNYTDPRLQREDAQTPLVDLVLRHPGYSDRNINQVLNILFSIEYHEASELAERSPCVVAWGIGLERAQSFKRVIENAGGKALLVEPGTFPES